MNDVNLPLNTTPLWIETVLTEENIWLASGLWLIVFEVVILAQLKRYRLRTKVAVIVAGVCLFLIATPFMALCVSDFLPELRRVIAIDDNPR